MTRWMSGLDLPYNPSRARWCGFGSPEVQEFLFLKKIFYFTSECTATYIKMSKCWADLHRGCVPIPNDFSS